MGANTTESPAEGAAPKTDAEKYQTIIDAILAPQPPPPLSDVEESEIVRLVKEARMSRASAEVEVLGRRPKPSGDKEAERATLAATRHRSYVPYVEAGLMTVYEAVREVGANRSADGRGQER